MLVAVTVTTLCVFPLRAQETTNQSNAASADEVRELRELVQELKAKVERLEKNANPQPTPQSTPANQVGADVVVSHEALVPEMKVVSQPQAAAPKTVRLRGLDMVKRHSAD